MPRRAAMSRISDDYPGPGSYEITPSRSITTLPSPRKGSPRRRSISPRPGSAPMVRRSASSPRLDPSPRAFAERYVPAAKESQGAYDHGTYSARGGFQFASEENRASAMFSHVDHLGDPAAYAHSEVMGVHTGHKETLGCRSRRSYNQNVAHGDGKFLSKSERRAASVPRSSEIGGPGEYSYPQLYVVGSPRAHSAIKSAFRSRTPLGGHVRKSTTPAEVGVGKYDAPLVGPGTLLKDDHNFSKQGASMFAGSPLKGRSDIVDFFASRTDKHVGPGYYDLSGDGDSRGSLKAKMENLKRRSKQTQGLGFGSSSPRKAYYE